MALDTNQSLAAQAARDVFAIITSSGPDSTMAVEIAQEIVKTPERAAMAVFAACWLVRCVVTEWALENNDDPERRLQEMAVQALAQVEL